jgi:hypothetical protein
MNTQTIKTVYRRYKAITLYQIKACYLTNFILA